MKVATPKTEAVNATRRKIIHGAGLVAGGSMLGLSTGGVWAAGSDKPEKEEIKIGFIPLTDCASVVMASVLGFDKKYGVKFVLSKEASWAGVRDKLANGDLDAAHVLYGLLYGVQMGIGGQKKDMAVLMGLNNNGRPSRCRRSWPTRAPSMAPRWPS
jgi:nitrate/nitrite transport system substrate-binding protein